MICLGIDCGTQGTKTLAVEIETGKVVAQASRAYGLLPGLPAGAAEQDPACWWQAVQETFDELLAALGDRRGEVAGIGISGQQHGFVAMDKDGQVIRPAKLWCDTSTAEECEIVRSQVGGKAALISEAGNDLPPGFTASKILWLKRHEPQNYARLATVLLPHDFLNFQLTGELSMEYGDASGTGLLDVRQRRWSKKVVDLIDPDLFNKLPPLRSSKQAAGTLRQELATRWGLESGVVVSAGGGDNMMGAIGTGNVSDGRITASLGTSGTIYAFSSKPVIDPEGEIAAFCDSTDGWLPLVCTMNVTVATEMVRKLFGWDVKKLDQAVATVPAGSDGLLFLPYLQGERTPNLPGATGVWHGMTLANATPAHIARAAMEGATLGLAYGLRRLVELGVQATEIRLTGGGSKSAVWRQICADVFGCPVSTLSCAEGAALGGAIQAAACAGAGDVRALANRLASVNPAESVVPKPESVATYRQLLDKQTALMRHLSAGGFL